MRGYDYTTVSVEVVEVRERSVLLDRDGDEQFVPRSLVHGADDRRLEDMAGEVMDVRVVTWKAEALGWS